MDAVDSDVSGVKGTSPVPFLLHSVSSKKCHTRSNRDVAHTESKWMIHLSFNSVDNFVLSNREARPKVRKVWKILLAVHQNPQTSLLFFWFVMLCNNLFGNAGIIYMANFMLFSTWNLMKRQIFVVSINWNPEIHLYCCKMFCETTVRRTVRVLDLGQNHIIYK